MSRTRKRQQASSVPNMIVVVRPEMSGSEVRSATTVMRHVLSIARRSSTVASAMAAMSRRDRCDLSIAPPKNIMLANAQWQQSMSRDRNLADTHRLNGQHATMATWKNMATRKKGLSYLQGTSCRFSRSTSTATTVMVIAAKPAVSCRSLVCAASPSNSGPCSAERPSPPSRDACASAPSAAGCDAGSVAAEEVAVLTCDRLGPPLTSVGMLARGRVSAACDAGLAWSAQAATPMSACQGWRPRWC
mmetsp:Transcript_58006/g.149299  ORF Transcript_58006/g.149299 Transcript_58006/m.149299 type:complete len:246 (-) Transcript_58006:38-775(-)